MAMETPLQLTFHQLPPSDALELDVNRWVSELEGMFDGIVGCRVVIDAPHHHHHKGSRYRVHVELGVPRGPIVVDRSGDENGAHEDPYVAIRDAFLAVRRQLEDHVRRLRGQVKERHEPPQGRVVHLEPDLAYGRLAADDGREIYFHRNSVISGIDRLALGAAVRFHEERGDDGPQASTVELIGANGHHDA
jgi:cold shock CspA family protein